MKVQKKIGSPGRSSNQVNKNLLFKYSLKSKLCQIEDILDSFHEENYVRRVFIMQEIRDNLSNLENSLADLKDQNNLIDLMINDYFGLGKIGDRETLKISLDYKTYQSLIFTVSKVLKDVEQNFDLNIYSIYEKIGKEV